jgi:hypothetical protein
MFVLSASAAGMPPQAGARVASAQDTCLDAYEPDDTLEQARPFVVGQTQQRTFCPEGNADWVSFRAEADTFYRIAASDLLPTNNAVLELYASDGRTLVDFADDIGGVTESRIVTRLPEAGTYYLRIRQVDARGNPGDPYTLSITAPQCATRYEPDDTPEQATPFVLDTVQTGEFCPANDEDWFSFAAEADTFYLIETRNIAWRNDTVLGLYSEDGTEFLEYDDDGGEGRASRIITRIEEAGTYLVRVSQFFDEGYPGNSYDLMIMPLSCNDSYEPDDSAEQAAPFEVGTTQNREFCPEEDVDWVSFVAEAGTLYALETSNLTTGNDTVLELYASDGSTLLLEDDDTAGDRASLIVWQPTETITAFVRVRQWIAGGYPGQEYDLTIAPTTCEDFYEPDDSAAQATRFDVVGVQMHRLCTTGDEDWVSFTAEADSFYRIETTNLRPEVDLPLIQTSYFPVPHINTALALYANDGSTLVAANESVPGSTASRILTPIAEAGTYYVQVQHARERGDPDYAYDLVIAQEVCPDSSYEPDDSPQAAHPIELGAVQTRALCTAEDEDWFTFTVEEEMPYVVETHDLTEGTATAVVVYAEDGVTPIDVDDNQQTDASMRLRYAALAPGTYHIQVHHAYAGLADPAYTYTLSVREAAPGSKS